MLSHSANPEPEAASVVTPTSLLREAAANHRRHPNFREFFRSWFVEGPHRILKGRFSKRAAGFMIACAMPAILAVIFMTLPGYLFQTPEHHAYFYFAKFVKGDSASNLPVLLGAVTSLFSFRFPLGS